MILNSHSFLFFKLECPIFVQNWINFILLWRTIWWTLSYVCLKHSFLCSNLCLPSLLILHSSDSLFDFKPNNLFVVIFLSLSSYNIIALSLICNKRNFKRQIYKAINLIIYFQKIVNIFVLKPATSQCK